MSPCSLTFGIDFFGLLYVKQGRSTVKHYGCLFSCLAMRTTHIEVTKSLEMDWLLMLFADSEEEEC